MQVTKIVKKSVYWSSHGKRRGMLGICCKMNRDYQNRNRHETPMYETVEEMMLVESIIRRGRQAQKITPS